MKPRHTLQSLQTQGELHFCLSCDMVCVSPHKACNCDDSSLETEEPSASACPWEMKCA